MLLPSPCTTPPDRFGKLNDMETRQFMSAVIQGVSELDASRGIAIDEVKRLLDL